ncbi:11093_t:CDS:2, partial [Ambispora leptoticha]
MDTYYDYFKETNPEEYRFLDFYKYRSKQTDFTYSFQKEADILRKCLSNMLRESSEDIKKRISLLLQDFEASYFDFSERLARSMGDFQQSREGVKTLTTTVGIYLLPILWSTCPLWSAIGSMGVFQQSREGKHRLRNQDINYFWNRIELECNKNEQQRLESERTTRTLRCYVSIRSKTQDMMENMAEETTEEAENARKRLHSEFSGYKQNEEGFSTPPNKIRTSNRMFSNESPSTIRDPKIMEIFDENIASDLKEKAQRSTSSFLSKKRACNTQQEDEKGITDEDLANSVIDASNAFGQVEFPLYYSKLKSIWNSKDATNYYVIDLGDKDTLYNVHNLLDEDELKSLFK